MEEKKREDMFRMSVFKHKHIKKYKEKNTIRKIQKTDAIKDEVKEKVGIKTQSKKDNLNKGKTLPRVPKTKRINKRMIQTIIVMPYKEERKNNQISKSNYILERDVGCHSIDEQERPQASTFNNISAVASVNNKLIVLKKSEECNCTDVFIPPPGFRILGDMFEVFDLGSSSNSNIFKEISNIFEPKASKSTVYIKLSDLSSVSSRVIPQRDISTTEELGFENIIICLGEITTKCGNEFLKVLEFFKRFFNTEDSSNYNFQPFLSDAEIPLRIWEIDDKLIEEEIRKELSANRKIKINSGSKCIEFKVSDENVIRDEVLSTSDKNFGENSHH